MGQRASNALRLVKEEQISKKLELRTTLCGSLSQSASGDAEGGVQSCRESNFALFNQSTAVAKLDILRWRVFVTSRTAKAALVLYPCSTSVRQQNICCRSPGTAVGRLGGGEPEFATRLVSAFRYLF